MELRLHQQQIEQVMVNAYKFSSRLKQRFFLKLVLVIEHKELTKEQLQLQLQTWLILVCVQQYKKVPMQQLPLLSDQIIIDTLQELLKLQNLQQLQLTELSVWQRLLKRMQQLFYKISKNKLLNYILFIETHDKLWKNLIINYTLSKLLVHVC